MLDIRYKFEYLEVGSSNKTAITKCKEICKSPHSHSGLWMFGPSGCGKTHLLKAVYNVLNYQETQRSGLYISAKELAELLYDFLGGGTNLWLQIKTYDYLLIDNMEDLRGRPRTQKVIAELVAEMIANKKLVLVASLCSPGKLRDLNSSLKTHRCDIPIVEIQSPDYELKKNIVEKYLSENPFDISLEACELLISKSTHIPRLKGILSSAKYLNETQNVLIEEKWIEQYGFWS